MKRIDTFIKGVYILEWTPFADSRGLFCRHFCNNALKDEGIDQFSLAQANLSINPVMGTFRGFHYQTGNCMERKIMSPILGSFLDTVIDLRPSSPTYKCNYQYELSATKNHSIHIPEGCANSFLTLQDNTIIHYYVSQYYSPDHEKGIRYDDPAFDINLPFIPKVVSKKDLSHPNYVDSF